MQLSDLPIETLRAELEFVQALLELAAGEASGKFTASTPICDYLEGDCEYCPIHCDEVGSLCQEMQCKSTVHAAAKEYIGHLEAAIAEKEGATDAHNPVSAV